MTASSPPPVTPDTTGRQLTEFWVLVAGLVLVAWAFGGVAGNLTVTRAPISAAAVMFVVPAVAAVVVASRHHNSNDLRRRMRLGPGLPAGWRWWVLAVGGMAAAVATEALWDGRPLFDRVDPLRVAGLAALFVVAAIAEEVGWTSFALPRMAARFGLPVAALLLGAGWAAIHLVPWYQGGHSWWWVAGQAAATVVMRLFLVQVTVGSRNWLWPAVLGHATSNLLWSVAPSVGSESNPWITTLALVVVIGLVAAGRHYRRLTTAVGVALAVMVLATTAALGVVFPSYRFPAPTGPHRVGTALYEWSGIERDDLLAPVPGTPRRLVAQIWYPAVAAGEAPTVPYLPNPAPVIENLAGVLGLPTYLPLAGLRRVTTNAVSGAPVDERAGRLPVLVFVSGLGGFRQSNTYQAEELASHGYAVVAIDLPYVSAATVYPDGSVTGYYQPAADLRPMISASYTPALPRPQLRGSPLGPGSILPFLGADVSFVLDRLTQLPDTDALGARAGLAGRLDQERMAIFGISLGGIVAGQVCATDPRVKACLSLEGPMPYDATRLGLRQPTMIISRSAASMRRERERAGGWSEEEIAAHHSSYRKVLQQLPGEGWYLEIDDMSHVDFTDAPWGVSLYRTVGLSGPLDGDRAHRIVNAYTLAFFNHTLRNTSEPLLTAASPLYPEVRFERRP